jgi:hypothetical protein
LVVVLYSFLNMAGRFVRYPHLLRLDGKRQEADVFAAPTGVLDRRTPFAARAAAGALP